MKANELKKMIKEAVKEAIQDELKEILLEAVKAPKHIVTESKVPNPTPQLDSNPSPKSKMDVRQGYMDILDETALSFTSKDVKKFNPQGVGDTTSPNGSLPEGEVGMDQIMGLMTNR